MFNLRSTVGLVPLMIALIVPHFSNAEIVFQDNFDNSPDWQSKQPTRGVASGITWGTPTFAETCTTHCPPQNWTAYRSAPSYWTAPNEKDSYIIDSVGARGAGKGLTYNVEVTGCYGTPCWSGGGIDKYLGPEGHDELYVRFWIKEPLDFCWGSPERNNMNSMGKFLRITALRRDPTINPNLFNPESYPSPDTSPTLIGNAYRRLQPNYGIPAQFDTEVRYAPNYEVPGVSITSASTLPNDTSIGGQGYCGDNQWHSYEYYVKLNTSLGATDGIYRTWLDGNLVAEKTDIPWIKPGTDNNGTIMNLTGWNWVIIADNMDIAAYPVESRIEMVRYIDDVVMYTPMNGTEQECAGACIGGRLPQSYTQGNLDNVPPLAPSNLAVL